MVVAGIRPRRYAWRAMAEGGDRIALIEAIYGAALEPGRWPLVMKALGDHFDGAAASMLMLDDSGGGCRFVARVGILGEPEMVERYRTYYGRLDPWPAELTRQGVGAVMQTSAVFDPDDPRAAAFVNEYFLPAGLVDSMGAALLHDEHRFALAAIQRSRQRGIFLDRDRQGLAALVPHLRTALRVHRQLAGTRAGAAEVALDQLSVGVLTVDHAGRVVHANKAARDVLARGDGLFIEQDRSLAALDRAANDVLQRLVAAAIQPAPGAGGALRLTRGDGGRTYAVLVAPLRRDDASSEIALPRRGALVLVRDSAIGLRTGPEMLTSLYGLTRSQAQLLQALLEGESLQQYAQRTGVRPVTARFHLGVVFGKTKTATQSQLMRKVVQDLAGLVVGE